MNSGILSVLHEENIDIGELFCRLPERIKEHCIAVSDFTAEILSWVNEQEETEWFDLQKMRKAAKYHDIGMALIPTRILKKQTELTIPEFKIVERHTLYGSKLIDNYRIQNVRDADEDEHWRLAAEIALSHHERWDGKGYPNGQKTTTVILPARATAIAAAFDTMVRGTDYRMPLPPEYALLEIVHNRGKQFDPMLTELVRKNCDSILEKNGLCDLCLHSAGQSKMEE